MVKSLLITKASGQTAQFSESKLRNSLKRAGATDDQINGVIDEISPQLHEGVSTSKMRVWRRCYSVVGVAVSPRENGGS